ncbi:MAG: hypothetical protein JRN38_04465 [Nitrososphaerota archaeon]|nr:hypothetical protein [Nitrososphaerota archaeon]
MGAFLLSDMGEPTKPLKSDWVKALDKAEEHLRAADALAITGNYGMAFSHIVLGLEEWTKRGILQAVGLGLAKLGTPDKVDPFRIRKRSLMNHDAKQTAGLGSILLALPIRGKAMLIAQARSEGRTLTEDEILARLRVDYQRVKKLAPYISRLEDMKQAGLYSGSRTSKGRTATCATRKEFGLFREILAELLESARWVVEHPLTAAEIKGLKALTSDLKTMYRPVALETVEAPAASMKKHST